MGNLMRWVLDAANGAEIEAVVIGEFGYADDGGNADAVMGKVISWDEAKRYLDYEFDSGYGGVSCHAICVWTADKVFGVSQYDGSTSLFSVQRNPVAHMPTMPGG